MPAMNTVRILLTTVFVAAFATVTFTQQTTTSPSTGSFAAPAKPSGGTGATAPTGQPSAADMQKMMQQMMEMSKLNENHKLLASLDGTWTYTVKMWMTGDPT